MDNEDAGQVLQQLAPKDELLQFARALVEVDRLAEMDELVYFLEKPWKYADEFVAWDEAGRPMDDSEPGWQSFADAVQE